jgi:hypothetical protein
LTIRYAWLKPHSLSAASAIDIAASHQPLIGCIVFQLIDSISSPFILYADMAPQDTPIAPPAGAIFCAASAIFFALVTVFIDFRQLMQAYAAQLSFQL